MPTAPTVTPASASGWSVPETVAELAAPVYQPAVAFSNGQPIIGYWSRSANGKAASLNLINLANEANVHLLSVGHAPDHLSLFPSPYGLLALWLDQNLTSADRSDRRLEVALLSPDLTVRRDPMPVADQSTTNYAALLLPSGDVAIAYTSHHGDAADSLSLSLVSATGTISQPLPIATNATHPALASIENGQLMAGWVSPQPGLTWAINAIAVQVLFDSTHKPVFQVGNTSTLGFLHPGGAQGNGIVDSFTLASDGIACYVIWSVTPLRTDANGGSSALTLPCASIGPKSAGTPVTPAEIEIAPNGRWVTASATIPDKAGPTPMGLTLIGPNGDVPAVAWLQNGGVIRLDKLTISAPDGTVGPLALGYNAIDSHWLAVWSQINPDGTIVLAMSRQTS